MASTLSISIYWLAAAWLCRSLGHGELDRAAGYLEKIIENKVKSSLYLIDTQVGTKSYYSS